MNENCFIRVATTADRGKLNLTEAGIGILRAILAKFVIDADYGRKSAMLMGGGRSHPFVEGQAAYFKHAASYLTGKMNSMKTKGFALDELLRIAREWPPDGPPPAEWGEYLILDSQMRGEYESGILDGRGGGGGGDGGLEPVRPDGGPEAVAEDHRPDGGGNPTADRERAKGGGAKKRKGHREPGKGSPVGRGTVGRARKPAPKAKRNPDGTGRTKK